MGVCKQKDRKERPYLFKFWWEGELYKQCGFKTKREAQAAEDRLRDELTKRRNSITFSQAVGRRLDTLKAYSIAKTFRDNVAILRRFSEWDDLCIEDITADMLRYRLIAIAKELGNHNANRHLTGLKAVFSQALKDELLTRNPCAKIDKFPVEKTVKRIPQKEDIAKVLLLAPPLERAYLTVIWLTGARVGEINNLTWEDVDFEGRKVRLWTRKKKGGIKTPRMVQMINQVYDNLQYAWKYRVKGSPWVFTNLGQVEKYPENPEKWRYDYRDKFLKTLCRLAGVPEINYHEFRHHTASALADKGVPLPVIQNILGHERATTTDLYLQALGRAVVEGMEVLEEAPENRVVPDLVPDIISNS